VLRKSQPLPSLALRRGVASAHLTAEGGQGLKGARCLFLRFFVPLGVPWVILLGLSDPKEFWPARRAGAPFSLRFEGGLLLWIGCSSNCG